MTAARPQRSRRWRTLGTGAVAAAACAVCCAGPLLAVVGGIGVASALAAIWVPALVVLAVVAVAVIVVVRRRRRVSACATEAGPVDLGLPPVGRPL